MDCRKCGTALTEKHRKQHKIDLIFTDPPYGIDLDTDYTKMPTYKGFGTKTYRRVQGDSVTFDPKLILEAFPKVKEIFLWGANYYTVGLPISSWIVWDKRQEEGSQGNSESLDRLFGSQFELCWSKQKHKYSIARILHAGFFNADGKETRVHPTQKPVRLAEWFFERWGKDAKNIWDGYLGSGSTLIACEKTNRRCFGCEIDPLYIDVILDRFEKFSGKTAKREDGTSWQDVKAQ